MARSSNFRGCWVYQADYFASADSNSRNWFKIPFGCEEWAGTIISLVTRLCILCSPMDCSLPGSSVCGISQTKILE